MESIKMISKGTSIGSNIVADKYRASLHLEHPTVQWRYGNPPTYETANHLFEEGRTKVLLYIYIFHLYVLSQFSHIKKL